MFRSGTSLYFPILFAGDLMLEYDNLVHDVLRSIDLQVDQPRVEGVEQSVGVRAILETCRSPLDYFRDLLRCAGLFLLVFSPLFLDLCWPFFSPSLQVVTQIWVNKVGASPSPPIAVHALHFYRQNTLSVSSLVDSHRIASTHATATVGALRS